MPRGLADPDPAHVGQPRVSVSGGVLARGLRPAAAQRQPGQDREAQEQPAARAALGPDAAAPVLPAAVGPGAGARGTWPEQIRQHGQPDALEQLDARLGDASEKKI